VCNRELVQLQEAHDRFAEEDAAILVIDAQETFRVRDWRDKLESPFTFLSDPTAWVSARYGVAKQIVVHDEWVSLPSAFIVDKEGILRYAHFGRGWPMEERATPQDLLAHLAE
jgi:thioredoxin-dependent peroxiredoxin